MKTEKTIMCCWVLLDFTRINGINLMAKIEPKFVKKAFKIPDGSVNI